MSYNMEVAVFCGKNLRVMTCFGGCMRCLQSFDTAKDGLGVVTRLNED